MPEIVSVSNQPPRETHALWSLLFRNREAALRGVGVGVVASFDEETALFPRSIEIVLLTRGSDGPLFLLGRATGSGFVGETASPRAQGVHLETVELSETPLPVPEDWIREKGRALAVKLEARGGNVPAVFRRMVDVHMAEAHALLERGREETAEAPSESPAESPHEPESESPASGPRKKRLQPAKPETPPAEQAAATSVGLPLSALLETSVSAAVRQMLDRAAAWAGRADGPPILRSVHLLDGVLSVGAGDLARGEADADPGAAGNFVQVLKARRDAFVRARLEAIKPGLKTPRSDVTVASDVQTIFARARELAEATGQEDQRIAGRHLIVAMLDTRAPDGARSAAVQALAAGGFDLTQVRADFVRGLVERGPEAERTAWGRVSAAAPPADQRAWLPAFNADLASGEDKLDMTPDIEAMASLIVSNTLNPPLSIGLFGNWGSGKSFFMQKLRKRIGELAGGRDDGSRSVYWPNVVTVEFNAWHFVDANLWASLVAHLFGELQRWGKEDASIAAGVKLQKQDALERLKVASEARDAARERLVEAKSALGEAQKKHREATGALKFGNMALSLELAKNLWTEVGAKPELAKPLEEARRQLSDGRLAASESLKSVERLHDQIKQLGETGGRLRATGLTMLHGSGRWVALAWLLGGTGLALLLGLRGDGRLDFGPVASVVAQVAAIVIAGADWITRSARKVSGLLGPLEGVRNAIEAAYQNESDKRDAKVAKLRGQVDASMAKVTVAVQTLAKAEQAVAAAEALVREATTARMISRFIESRAGSEDYRRHLGIVSTIREDFDHLSKLISAHNTALLESAASPAAASNVDSNVAPPPLPAAAGTTDLGINRIVLFIDDLDRCPPARVVEVLQAIHLLLAFPLFVVVVGVDSRWVEHSLTMEYPELLKRTPTAGANGADGAKESEDRSARPSDYLEKIFQIPYRVRRLDATGCRGLIDALVAGDRDTPRVAPNESPGRLPPAPALLPDGEVPPPRNLPPRSDRDPAAGGARTKSPLKVEPAAVRRDSAPPRIDVAALRLTEGEIVTMKALAWLIGRSPRATKRFVNIYRLLKAAVPAAEQEAFLSGGYVVPMLLLAASTKSHALAAELAVELAKVEMSGTSLREVLARLNVRLGEESLANVLAALRHHADTKQPVLGVDVPRWHRRVAQFSFEETSL